MALTEREKIISNLFWGTKSVASYTGYLTAGIPTGEFAYEYRKNIAYNLMYLEVLNNCFEEKLHSVTYTEFVKSFVVTGVSIIESIFYSVLKQRGLNKTTEWEESIFKSNEKLIDGVIFKTDVRLFRKLKEPVEEQMNLDWMLKQVQKHKLLGEPTAIYSKLNMLRKLRNKIHLHLVETNFDTDWHNFSYKELRLIKEILYLVLTSPIFLKDGHDETKQFDFLFDSTPS